MLNRRFAAERFAGFDPYQSIISNPIPSCLCGEILPLALEYEIEQEQHSQGIGQRRDFLCFAGTEFDPNIG